KISGGWLYAATAGGLKTSNLSVTSGTVYNAGGGRADAVAVIGSSAVTVTNNNYTIWGVSVPTAAPVASTGSVAFNTGYFRQLVPYADRYVVALSSHEQASTVGTVIRVIDLQNPSLGFQTNVQSQSYSPIRGRIQGSTLYVSTTVGGVMLF